MYAVTQHWFVLQVCMKCGDVIKTTSVTYEGHSFHSDCFVCAECGKPLAGKAFCRMEDQRVCHDCYLANHAKTCSGCLKSIEGQERYIVYDNQHYHRDCFTCDSCKKPMAGEKFRLRNETERICMQCSQNQWLLHAFRLRMIKPTPTRNLLNFKNSSFNSE